MTNPYTGLLEEFRAAAARNFGLGSFHLFALTAEEGFECLQQDVELIRAAPVSGATVGSGRRLPCWIGRVPFRLHRRPVSLCILAPCTALRKLSSGKELDMRAEKFRRLAARAGACLPAIVRDAIPCAPSDPVDLWLAFMLASKPPSRKALLPTNSKRWGRRAITYRPFLDAAEVIERSGLLQEPSAPLETLQRVPLWDMHPLGRGSRGNITGLFDEPSTSAVLDMRRWRRPSECRNCHSVYRPAHVRVPPLWRDGGMRHCYRPRPEDLAIVRHCVPRLSRAEAPPWRVIKASLIAAGHNHDELMKLQAPELLERLSAAENISRPQSIPKESDVNSEPPPLDVYSLLWVDAKRAAQKEGVKTATLTKYRSRGERAEDRMSGTDPSGRKWRRRGTRASHPWYYKPSLLSERGKANSSGRKS
jgi:hypothetical protein